jgi:alkylhydroperoxidase family enzyme
MMPRNSLLPPLALFRTLLRHPDLADAMEPIGKFLLALDGHRVLGVTRRDRELVILRTCARCRCEYEWGIHATLFADKVGLSVAQIEATARSGPADNCWSVRDRLLLYLSDEMHQSQTVGDHLWRKLTAQWSDAEILELLTLAGWYHLISFITNAAGVELESWARRFPTLVVL